MFVVFSSNEDKRTVLNDLIGLAVSIKQVMPVKGAYKGNEEQAFVVHCGYDAVPAIHKLVLEDYEQEALLLVDANLDCKMYTAGKGVVGTDVGRWQIVTQKEALAADAYTRIAQDYFMVK